MLFQGNIKDHFTPQGYAIVGDSAFSAQVEECEGKLKIGRKRREQSDDMNSADLTGIDYSIKRY